MIRLLTGVRIIIELVLIASGSPVILPTISGSPRDILEVGCGSARTLAALGLPNCRLVALDIDREALRRSEQRDQAALICGNGEALLFADRVFDLVISKVALPYMDIPVALREMNRVLRPGGQLFLTLHHFDLAWARIRGDLKSFRFRDTAYQLYAVLNGLSLGWLDVQFRWPLNRSRCESVQSVHAMQTALRRAGFDEVITELRGQVFAAEARKSRGAADSVHPSGT